MLVGVIAHPSRETEATTLQSTLNATLFMDWDSRGAWWNHHRAWAWASQQDERVVLVEDDALPVPRFLELAEQWADRHPGLVSLYTGTGHPKHLQPALDAAWPSPDDHVLLPTLAHHVAVLLPIPSTLTRVLDQVTPSPRVDFALGNAYRAVTGRHIPHVKASLADHADTAQIDNPTLHREPRRARQLAQ